MELEYVKWIAAISLLTLTLLFCSLPLCLQRSNRNGESLEQFRYKRALSLISCCGGGVFLGTCFLHLLPEVQEQMTKVFLLLHINQTFPVPEFLTAFGFLLILIIEQIVLSLQQQSDENLPFLSHQHSHSNASTHNSQHSQYGAVSDDSDSSETNRSLHEDQSSHSPLRSVVLVLALSLHSIFEGFAIGLQSTSENVLRILIAVLIHKSIIAFTLGLNLLNSKLKPHISRRCALVFSTMSPLGTVIGSLISDVGSGLSMAIASGILQGIATGTFVYVTFFEVLPHEFNSKEDKMYKVLSLVLGFSAMTFIVLYIPA